MLRRVTRAARVFLDWIPITGRGVLVVAVGIAGLFALAIHRMDLVWLMIASGILGLASLGVLLVVIVAIVLKVRLRPSSDGSLRIETGRFFETGYRVRGLGLVPLLRVRVEWIEPAGAEVRWESKRFRLFEHVRIDRRGEIRGIRRRILIEDALGLARVGIRQRDPLAIDVLPNPEKLRQLPFLATFAGGDDRPHPLGIDEGDRVEIRRYVPGDPARLIHWKIYGRTRQLMVRLPERSLSISKRVVAYLVAGPDDESSAAAARLAVESGAFGDDWSFGADGTAGATSQISDAVQRIVRSGMFAGSTALESFLVEAERTGPVAAIIFVPAADGSWLDAVLAASARRTHRVRVVVGTDGAIESVPLTRWQRWLLRPERKRVANSTFEVAERLSRQRIPVTVVDRKAGRILRDVEIATLTKKWRAA